MDLEMIFKEGESIVLYTSDMERPELCYLMAQCPKERGQIKLFGRYIDVPRFQKTYFRNYNFSRMDHECEQYDDKNHWHQYLMKLVEHCNGVWHMNQESLGAYDDKKSLNGVLVNWYHDGLSYIGHHSDDESSLVPLSPIFSFSFGAQRDFHIRPKKNSEYEKKRNIRLLDGSLIIMAGTLQSTHTHSLPVRKRCTKPRVNITIRAFV